MTSLLGKHLARVPIKRILRRAQLVDRWLGGARRARPLGGWHPLYDDAEATFQMYAKESTALTAEIGRRIKRRTHG